MIAEYSSRMGMCDRNDQSRFFNLVSNHGTSVQSVSLPILQMHVQFVVIGVPDFLHEVNIGH